MKKIEITTAQKVIIQYELASLKDRFFAFLIDVLIWGIGLSVIWSVIMAIIIGYENFNELSETLAFLILVPIFLFYTLVSEIISNGRTLGKKIMGLKVMKLNGGLPTIDDYLMRWVFRCIDIYTSFGAVAALLVSSSDKAQRLGGLLSNTAVIKLKSGFNIKLDDLEKMFEASDSYEAIYPEVVQFNDTEMLVLKELMKRYTTKPNRAHTKLLNETSNQLALKLGMSKTPMDKMDFLQSVLKDYVMLTR